MDSIDIAFNTPTEMTLFSWDGDIDTVLSPMDSIHYYKYLFQAGLMSVQPQTGHVKAYVGGIDYRYFKYDHVTQAKRQVGSTFKPFVYTLAMQEGNMSPCSKMANVQPIIRLPDGTFWKPHNSNKKFDLVNYHNIGNIWLRVSNYGFFGSGYAVSPQWPSLEYPGGSAISNHNTRRNIISNSEFFL